MSQLTNGGGGEGPEGVRPFRRRKKIGSSLLSCSITYSRGRKKEDLDIEWVCASHHLRYLKGPKHDQVGYEFFYIKQTRMVR
jgi:hypothetical protein